jgi:Tfp pilus tip-associated adhesin PilY1
MTAEQIFSTAAGRWFCLPLLLAAALATGRPAAANPAYTMKDFESWPTSVVEGSVTPQVMLNASNDHQLFFKAYNDYSDLDNNGIIETTYDPAIDYYGYFDSTKCYEYDTERLRFEPRGMADGQHYCTGAMDSCWSGNFLSWATMTRIDVIRKILFGGHRRVDTDTETVLERSYLPHDAHSWAKQYDSPDIQELTPFVRGVDYDCDRGDLSGCRDAGGVLVEEKIGITLGSTTDVDMADYNRTYSEVYEAPPLLKVVRGNYALWGSNERWQITWAAEAPADNHPAENSNDKALSGISAYSSSPDWAQGIGRKNYVVRVQACVAGLIGGERCKLYPGADETFGTADDNFKPIGLLQHYGDDNRMAFGMVAGTYNKHTSGGEVIRNMESLNSEVNVRTDGTFPLVSESAGGPMASNKADGLLNAWSLYRIIGYNGADGTYADGDNCPWGLTAFAAVTADNRCRNWGNPFAEIYYQSINYLSGNGVIGDYRSNSATGIPGLPVPQPYQDPLDGTKSCAPLSIINLNASVISYDFDQMDGQSYGPATVWDANELPGNRSTLAMADVIGAGEGIHGHDFYVGQIDLTDTTEDQICTAKTVESLGGTGGVCPEAPRLLGSYRLPGLAYYAHIKDIRPDNATGNRGLKGMQKVDTYSVAMASALPLLEISHPLSREKSVRILPACRNTSLNPAGNCAIVDFKVVEQVANDGSGRGRGKVYINWEDSEQGGDFDQDMWGTLLYEINGNSDTVTVTTQVHGESTGYAMGFGYVISGTNDDGFHVHSGINGFQFNEQADTGDDCADGDGCLCNDPYGACTIDGSSAKTYRLGTSRAELLKDPLWYAAKWGGFIDQNNNDLPDQVEEWDRQINATGLAGQDGIPDTYFYASHPRELEDALNRVLTAILERTSSGTSAAVVASNVRGEGALYQAYYEPLRLDHERQANWVGTVQALWLDSAGYTRQDCSPPGGYDAISERCVPAAGPCRPNGRLDNYCIDQVAETFYDDREGKTRVRIYSSEDPASFAPYSMQGVAESSVGGSLTLVPNSMEGNVTYTAVTGEMALTPYTVRATLATYDQASGAATLAIGAGDWQGPDGRSFSAWRISSASGSGYGFSSDPLTLAPNPAVNLTINPAGPWLAPGDTLTLETQNMVGASGDTFANWGVECLQGAAATAEVNNFSISLSNWNGAAFIVENTTEDLSPCTMARIATFNMRGTACTLHDDWRVTDLTRNTGVQGASSSALPLMNSLHDPACPAGAASLHLTVDPGTAWIAPGDRIMLANYQFTDRELHALGYLWNAREQLYLENVPDESLRGNRFYSAPADLGRHIMTWIDSNLNNEVDRGEYREFTQSMFPEVSPGFYDVDTREEAEAVVDYVRGIEVPGTRGRTIRYRDSDVGVNVMRLGDIVNSTPTVVGSPQEAFNLLYGDRSYTEFRRQYQQRRIMVYAGGNDGLLHAFNGGFLDVVDDDYGNKTIAYAVSRRDGGNNNLDVAHPLGSEIWAYAPKNLLSHLRWLKDPNYAASHVFYVDGAPRVFDANIFTGDADHPGGWGTVLVVGMNMGGGEMEIDTAGDDHLAGERSGDNNFTRSAYIVFDITNPEQPPQLLGEIQLPDRSYTTVHPAVISFRDAGTATRCDAGNTRCNSWYLVFGTGPNDLATAESNQSAKLYLFELSQLTTAVSAKPADGDAVPAGCRLDPLTAATNIITCDTGMASTFMGTPVIVDWDLDFFADTAYFGLVGDQSGSAGAVFRQSFADDPRPGYWSGVHPLYQADQPVSVQPVPAIDRQNNRWLFFGTGRYKALGDKTSTTVQSLYGIKDDNSTTSVGKDELLDVTATEVYSDGSIANPPLSVSGPPITTFAELEEEIDLHAGGWYLDLPPITGMPGIAPATRSIANNALLGGVLFSPVFQPSADPCSGEGLSRLYGLYYKTGTAYPGPLVFGATPEDGNDSVKLRGLRFLDLGRGMAATPTLHSGADTGTTSLSIFSQLSTGENRRDLVDTILPVRTGKLTWREQESSD